MRGTVSQSVGAFLSLLVGYMCAGSAAGSVLQVEVAAVGGSIASSAPSGCTTYSRPPLIGTFSTGANLVPLGGIASCGYQGGVQGGSAAVGPLLLEQSVTASYTDSSVFNATARARVNYGEMGIYLTGSRNGGSGGTDVTGASAVASQVESFLIDATGLTGQFGSVRFVYAIDGSVSNSSTTSGQTNAQMRYLVNGSPSGGFTIFSANFIGSGSPFLPFTPVQDNWTVSPGSLVGSASYATDPISFTFGSSFDLQMALLGFTVPVNGSATADLYSTARLTQIEVRNAQGQLVNGFSVIGGSGTLYDENGLVGAPIPEPNSFLLIAPVLAFLWSFGKGKKRSA